MRRHYSEVDSKTGYEMVLSEASYNMACDWLDRDARRQGFEIWRTEYDGKHHILWVGSEDGHTTNRRFFYDEERGYLMGE